MQRCCWTTDQALPAPPPLRSSVTPREILAYELLFAAYNCCCGSFCIKSHCTKVLWVQQWKRTFFPVCLYSSKVLKSRSIRACNAAPACWACVRSLGRRQSQGRLRRVGTRCLMTGASLRLAARAQRAAWRRWAAARASPGSAPGLRAARATGSV